MKKYDIVKSEGPDSGVSWSELRLKLYIAWWCKMQDSEKVEQYIQVVEYIDSVYLT